MRRIDCQCTCYLCETGVEHCHNPLAGCKTRKKKDSEPYFPERLPDVVSSNILSQIEGIAPKEALVVASR